MIAEPQTWVLIGLAVSMAALAVFALRGRSLFAAAAVTATMTVVAACGVLALDAPDVALVMVLAGVGIVAPLFLGAVSLTASTATLRKPRWLSIAVVVTLGALVIWATADLPELGARSLTAGAGAGVVYVNRALGESGVASAVMAVSANYRAIDTILAVSAVFVALLGVYAALGFGERSALRQEPSASSETAPVSAHRPVVMRAAGKFAIPLLFVFAAHLAVSGGGAPGGGFAAACAFASGIVLFGLLFGVDAARRAVPTIALRAGAGLGVVLLLGIGIAGFVRGYGFLDFRALTAPGPGTMRLGATLIEAGVALAVSCSFILAFFAIAARAAEIRDDEW